MKLGIILVHGYTGKKQDLSYLESKLSNKYGTESVNSITLSGHKDINSVYTFSLENYISDIQYAAKKFSKERRKLIFIGHSTGGVFVLKALQTFNFNTALVILLGTPYKVDINYLKRWQNVTKQSSNISFTDTSNMVSTINHTCSKYTAAHPLIIINGDQDELVLGSTLIQWKNHNYKGNKRIYTVESGKHQLLESNSKYFTSNLIIRNIDDLINNNNKAGRSVTRLPKEKSASNNDNVLDKVNDNINNKIEENDYDNANERKKMTTQLNSLFIHEPKLKKFIANNPYASFHIKSSPSFKKLNKEKINFNSEVLSDPIIANICISSHCNLKCKYCYRTQNPANPEIMSISRFKQILEYLPNTYKITLVGSGEPLTHPNIIDFVKHASEQNRKVTIVTNAMLLKENISKELIKNGLDSITLSIDYFDQISADFYRNGTDFNTVKNNIHNFMKNSKSVTTAVFSAVSNENFRNLNKLIDFIAELKIHVLMLSDLNFASNRKNSLSNNINTEKIQLLRKSIKYGFSKKIIILTVRALEQFAIKQNFSDYLLIPPDQLFKLSKLHSYCFSPWQTLPIDVNGNVSICDCQAKKILGNILSTPFSEIWNGKEIINFRKKMLSSNPPEECKICPRF